MSEKQKDLCLLNSGLLSEKTVLNKHMLCTELQILAVNMFYIFNDDVLS